MQGAGGGAEHLARGRWIGGSLRVLVCTDVNGFGMICALLLFCYGGSASSRSFLAQHESEAREEGALLASIPRVNG